MAKVRIYELARDLGLESKDVLERAKEGRRNHYLINTEAHLRHAMEEHCTVGELLQTVLHPERSTVASAGGAATSAGTGGASGA